MRPLWTERIAGYGRLGAFEVELLDHVVVSVLVDRNECGPGVVPVVACKSFDDLSLSVNLAEERADGIGVLDVLENNPRLAASPRLSVRLANVLLRLARWENPEFKFTNFIVRLSHIGTYGRANRSHVAAHIVGYGRVHATTLSAHGTVSMRRVC
jgi:hypothetical protein